QWIAGAVERPPIPRIEVRLPDVLIHMGSAGQSVSEKVALETRQLPGWTPQALPDLVFDRQEVGDLFQLGLVPNEIKKLRSLEPGQPIASPPELRDEL